MLAPNSINDRTMAHQNSVIIFPLSPSTPKRETSNDKCCLCGNYINDETAFYPNWLDGFVCDRYCQGLSMEVLV